MPTSWNLSSTSLHLYVSRVLFPSSWLQLCLSDFDIVVQDNYKMYFVNMSFAKIGVVKTMLCLRQQINLFLIYCPVWVKVNVRDSHFSYGRKWHSCACTINPYDVLKVRKDFVESVHYTTNYVIQSIWLCM